jgi:protein-tyrosine-phosphatase
MAVKPSCRTQMAEAFLRELTGDELEIVSAGSEAGRLDSEAVAAMREVGIGRARYFPARCGARRGSLRVRPRWRRMA